MTFSSFFQALSNRNGPAYGAGPAGFKRLLKRLGQPQQNYPIIHVAGTNGKGSVCYLTANVLQSAGYRTGLFISPHLQSPTERIELNGKCITKPTLQRLCEQVLAAEQEKLNFFEILTAAAFLYFAQKKAAYVVLETGLGGRKDPTNVCRPAASVITSVGLDHCAVLGNTLRQIAREKAGIIKPQVPVFCLPVPTQARAVICAQARLKKAPLHWVKPTAPFRLHRIDWQQACLHLVKQKQVWKLSVLGEKQVQNACLVYQLAQFLQLPQIAIRKGFASVQIPGRFEVFLMGDKVVILDGAHNPQAISGLIKFVRQSPWKKDLALVCGFMKDKDYPAMLRQLRGCFKHLYLTSLAHPRAATPRQLLACLPVGAGAKSISPAASCLQEALAQHSCVVVSGSFYLLGQLRALLQKGLLNDYNCARRG